MKDIKITLETLNGDGSILNTTSIDTATTVSNSFEAGDTIQINSKNAQSLLLNGLGIALSSTGNMTYGTAETIRVTVIDTPSGSVLSKPSAKIT